MSSPPLEVDLSALRTLLAPNASPMTLDGTRTFIVGRRRAAVIDPGPDDPAHLQALVAELADTASIAILLTHRHPDHAAGAEPLARLLGTRVTFGPAIPSEGDVVATEAGELHPLRTPGHTPDHVAIHWPAERAIFCGDLMMGGLDTALVAAPEGNLGDYLDSLERLRSLRPWIIHPAHGAPFDMPDAAISSYRVHRSGRIEQVRLAVAAGCRSVLEIAEHVYGGAISPDLRYWSEATTRAYLQYMTERGLISRGDWE